MDVLVIGGGVFVGRHITDALLRAGHRVTHFNRGQAAPPRNDVETIAGDRTHDVGRLATRSWDAVVNTCGYAPASVRLSTSALEGRVGRYVFISSVSVYDYDRIGPNDRIDESAPLAALPPGADTTTVAPETYGALKALCEGVAIDAFADRATVLRCGLMVGSHDRTDRFTYWPLRYSRAGRMLAPGGPDEPMQFVDVRDVAGFAVRVLEKNAGGIFNLTGTPRTTTFGSLFAACREVLGARPEIAWLDRAAIARAGLTEWEELPLWVADAAFMRKLHDADVHRALAAGLTLRPLAETVRDTLAWAQGRAADYVLQCGMTPEREAEALASAGA